jgi:hypothetical protein
MLERSKGASLRAECMSRQHFRVDPDGLHEVLLDGVLDTSTVQDSLF